MINDNKRPLYEKGLEPEDWYNKIKNWCSLLSSLLVFFLSIHVRVKVLKNTQRNTHFYEKDRSVQQF